MQAAVERKRSVAAMRAKDEDRTGFARIYFENKSFTSSTVFKLVSNTTVLEVRRSMAAKIKIPVQDFNNYAIVVVFPTDNAGSLSARTLRDDELILPLVEKLNRARPMQAVEADDTIGGTARTKVKHRQRPPVKFVLKVGTDCCAAGVFFFSFLFLSAFFLFALEVLKEELVVCAACHEQDVQGSHLDISDSAEKPRRKTSETQSINFPVLLGKVSKWTGRQGAVSACADV
ncbi:unnamed protein product [Phytophthora fragariaefolia]|uniref:Unnamed protein product n=1 Tax=Phytophthora fragariaefolia TaxID=1490495 RepID=A0A9W6Y341_9STRA|nr:unnamed protein product [Phytophthora fragariaefolia]